MTKPLGWFAWFSLILMLLVSARCACAARDHPEAWWQERAALELGAACEIVLPDRSRCDLVTETHAIEVDFDDKWAEAVGQSALYAALTGKRPGIVLVCERGVALALDYVTRLMLALGDRPCDVWLAVGEGQLLRVR